MPTINREEILTRHPLLEFAQNRGAKVRRVGKAYVTNLCPIMPHKRGHNCVSLDLDKQVWHCNDHKEGGTVIDWTMKEKGMDAKQAMEELGGGSENEWANVPVDKQSAKEASTHNDDQPPQNLKEVETYNYTDENGKMLYQVVRYEPKTFKQRRPKGEDWEWNLEGITRVLYNLPKVLLSPIVVVVEGEKDAEALAKLGFTATTNCGGSSAWFEAYADTLKGKDVIIFPDNDIAGRKHSERVIGSIREKANSVRKVLVPDEFKDVSEWLATIPEDERGLAVTKLIDETPHLVEPPPLYTALEMEERYREYIAELPKRSFSLGKFCPSFQKFTKNLAPGELVMIMGDTGVGKTTIMQNIAKSAAPLPTLFFELELPLELMFQRQVQSELGCYEEDVMNTYSDKEDSSKYAGNFEGMKHLLVCPQSGINMDTIERYIVKSELKFGKHPVLVMIDYMGLVKKDNNKSRYEAIANAAEQAKVIAKRTNTIVFMGSQVARPQDRKLLQEIELHHAKGAGELESSANLVIGCIRPDKNHLNLKILKNTRGPVGDVIKCDFNGAKMQIEESVNVPCVAV